MVMIQAVVLDVDGVIVGDQEGVNFPHPHGEVIECLKRVRQKGIYVSLCTGKPAFAIKKIVNGAYLNNMHIVDGGAAGIDPIEKQVSFKYVIGKEKVLLLAHFYQRNNIFMEFHTGDEYILSKTQVNEQTKGFIRLHINVLEKKPEIVDDNSLLRKKDIVKIILMARDAEQKRFISETFQHQFAQDLELNWTMNPSLLNWKVGLVTLKGVSKRKGVENISKYLNVPLDNILGIGDTMIDWSFIEICGYGGTMANASEKLKDLVLQKGKRYGFVGRGVNENGVIDVLKHFGLT